MTSDKGMEPPMQSRHYSTSASWTLCGVYAAAGGVLSATEWEKVTCPKCIRTMIDNLISQLVRVAVSE
jgi:hypothetical protein